MDRPLDEYELIPGFVPGYVGELTPKKKRGRPRKVVALPVAVPVGEGTPPIDYEIRVKGPQPGEAGAYVLVLYDRPTPFGVRSTLYSIDALASFDGHYKGYLGKTLIIQFPHDMVYVLVNKNLIAFEQAKPEAHQHVGFALPEDSKVTNAVATTEIDPNRGYL